jgi:hypothetical protein
MAPSPLEIFAHQYATYVSEWNARIAILRAHGYRIVYQDAGFIVVQPDSTITEATVPRKLVFETDTVQSLPKEPT